MKYLRKFNESLATEQRDEIIRKLKHVSEELLITLLDKGLSIFVWGDLMKEPYDTPPTIYNMEVHKDDKPFRWSEISDTYITYLEYIKDEYDIKLITICFNKASDGNLDLFSKRYKIDDILNNKVEDRDMYNIMLKIENPII